MKKRPLFLLALLLSITTLRSVAQAPQYTIRTEGEEHIGTEAARIQAMHVETLIVGGLSTTLLDLRLYNPSDKLQRVDLSLPLPPGWELAGFALDIEGKLRDAVPVPKAKGQEAFKAVVRRGVDPALIEHVEGNVFRTSIYPVAAKGTRRIVLRLDHPLALRGGEDAFEFPYTFPYPIREFSFALRIVERPVEGVEIQGLDGAKLQAERQEVVLNYRKDEAELKTPVRVKLPRQYSPRVVQAQGKEQVYYALSLEGKTSVAERPKPKYLNILWDVSESQRTVNKQRAIELLRAYIQWMERGKIHLQPFSTELHTPTAYAIREGQCEQLFEDIAQLRYDGGTDLNALDWSELGGEMNILVSDGLQSMPFALKAQQSETPVICVNISPVQNSNWLAQEALRSGGAYIDLCTESQEDALALMTERSQVVLSWTAGMGRESCPTAVGRGVQWVFGKSSGAVKEIAVQWADGEKTRIGAKAEGSPLWKDEAIAQLLRRAYKRQEVERLRKEGKTESAEALAQREGIATEQTSLIVLERVEDYAAYHITPPEELLDEYKRRLQKEVENADSLRKQRIEALVKLSEAQTKWWNSPARKAEKKLGKISRVVVTRSASRTLNAQQSQGVAVEAAEVSAMDSPNEIQAEQEEEAEEKARDNEPRGSIQLRAWDSQSPYLKVLEYAEPGREMETYYRLKREYGDAPAFYLDAAGFLFGKGMRAEGYRALSSVLEIAQGAKELLRATAKEFEKRGYAKEAEAIYRRLIDEAPQEPQHKRDLALLLNTQGDYQAAVDLLYEVATGAWDQRFRGIELIALNEMNGILDQQPLQRLDIKMIDSRLMKHEPVDVRIVLSWGNDDVDVDLHVEEPSGEECYFAHRETEQGGKLSNDMTRGYGPEEYMQRLGQHGEYVIKAKLYADHTQTSIVPKYLHAVCYLYYGTPRQEKKEMTLRLTDIKEVVEIGRVKFSRP